MSKIIQRPLDYPFDVPRSSYCAMMGKIIDTDIIIKNKTTNFEYILSVFKDYINNQRLCIKNPIGFLSCGSNASPGRLIEKLALCAVPQAFALRLSLRNWIPVHAATLSFYGAVPATFEYIHDSIGEPYLIVTDSRNFHGIVGSEQHTGNYDLYEVSSEANEIMADFRVFSFVSRFGALKIDGEFFPLKEFQPENICGVFKKQPDIIRYILNELGCDMSLDNYMDKVQDTNYISKLREMIIRRFGANPNVPGWKRID